MKWMRSRMLNGFRVVTALCAVSAPFRRGTLWSRPVRQRFNHRGPVPPLNAAGTRATRAPPTSPVMNYTQNLGRHP